MCGSRIVRVERILFPARIGPTQRRLQEKVDAMRAVETQMSNLRREISALDSTATPLFHRDQRTQLLARAFGRLEHTPAKQDIWITELISDLRRQTSWSEQSGTRENNFRGIAHALADGLTSRQPNQ